MFKVSEETKAEAVASMREILSNGVTDESLSEAFDVAVAIVKKSFGM